MHARRHRARVVALDDPGVDQFMQVPDEHALGDAGDAAPQLGGPHRTVAEWADHEFDDRGRDPVR